VRFFSSFRNSLAQSFALLRRDRVAATRNAPSAIHCIAGCFTARHYAATCSRPRFRDFGAARTMISTSLPSAVRKSISRWVEKPLRRPWNRSGGRAVHRRSPHERRSRERPPRGNGVSELRTVPSHDCLRQNGVRAGSHAAQLDARTVSRQRLAVRALLIRLISLRDGRSASHTRSTSPSLTVVRTSSTV
jgi:hypothetical protein